MNHPLDGARLKVVRAQKHLQTLKDEIAHYLSGETLIEAYWKSVAMPGQGIFVGEPLAAPFRRATAR